jgi:hypothetical protein
MTHAHPGCHIVATLTGRLETRDHFDVHTFQDGLQYPIAFKWFVAQLLYRAIDDFEAVPLELGELEQETESRRRPYAVRLESGDHDSKSVAPPPPHSSTESLVHR